MESAAAECPFLSKDLLARIPESKRQELEQYYTQLKSNQGAAAVSDSAKCPISGNTGDDEMMQMMQAVDEEMITPAGGSCPVTQTIS